MKRLLSTTARSILGQKLVDQRHQVARTVRLGQVRRGARVHRLAVVAAQGERRHHHQWDVGGARIGAEQAGRIESRQLGQLDVHQDEIGQLALSHREPLLAVGGLQQAIGRPAQELSHDLPIVFVVLDVEHRPVLHAGPPSAWSGTVKKKVEPRPSSLSTPTRPPCISTSRLVMLSPSPVPPYSRVMVVSTWRNSAKMFSTSSLGMPMPVSATLNVSHPSARLTSMSTRPWRVNLSAFPARFSRHWVSRRPSPQAAGISGATCTLNASPFSMARDRSEACTTSTISCTEYSPRPSSSRPASIFDKSRTSLMSRSRWRPLVWMSTRGSRRLAGTSPYSSSSMISVNPRIALSGVRSSWLMLARNSDLGGLAGARRTCRRCVVAGGVW